jgi:uncharacterized protein (TIGR02594 family)
MVEPKWLTLARAEIGTHEIAGEHDNPKIIRYYADAGHPEIKHDETAWCAAFACAMLQRAGENSPKTLSAREFVRWGKKLDKPKLGCICVFSRGDPRSYQGHVGFYVGEEDGNILLLGGNQGDAASIAQHSKNNLLGYRWPVQAGNSITMKGVAGAVAGTATAATTAMTQVATSSSDQVIAIGSEVKGLSEWVPWLGIVGTIITIIALGFVTWAHFRDLTKNGK